MNGGKTKQIYKNMIKLKFNETKYNEWLSSDNVIIDDDIYHKCGVDKKILYLYCICLNFKKNDEFIYNIKFNNSNTNEPDIYVVKYLNGEHITNRIFRYGKNILIDDILYIFNSKDSLFIIERFKKIQKIKAKVL